MTTPKDNDTIIFDIGSQHCNIGLTCLEVPFVIPSVMGVCARHFTMVGTGSRNTYAGDEAVCKPCTRLGSFIEHGFVVNWDWMQTMYSHLFYNELRVAPEEHLLFMTETPLNPKHNRERNLEILFEVFGTFGVSIASPAVLSLYAIGLTSGIGFDAGHSVSHVAPVIDGQVIYEAIEKTSLAGRDIDLHLQRLLSAAGHQFQTTPEMRIVQDIKHKCCDLSATENQTFELPDKQKIQITANMCQAPEVLFHSDMVGMKHNLPQMILNSLEMCDKETQQILTQNLVLSGGSTKYAGFDDRLLKELSSMSRNKGEEIQFQAKSLGSDSRRYLSAWFGAQAYAPLAKYITLQEYKEVGASIGTRLRM